MDSNMINENFFYELVDKLKTMSNLKGDFCEMYSIILIDMRPKMHRNKKSPRSAPKHRVFNYYSTNSKDEFIHTFMKFAVGHPQQMIDLPMYKVPTEENLEIYFSGLVNKQAIPLQNIISGDVPDYWLLLFLQKRITEYREILISKRPNMKRIGVKKFNDGFRKHCFSVGFYPTFKGDFYDKCLSGCGIFKDKKSYRGKRMFSFSSNPISVEEC